MVERVTLYRAPTTVADVDAIADWLAARIEAGVEVRDRFLDLYADDELADAFAAARVLSPYERETGNTMLGIVRYEQRALDHPERAGGVIYDGLQVQRSLGERLPADERGLDHLHVPVLDRVLGTWGDHDGRWHKRVNVLGQPALVSVPGLYEAPAKPEQYYKEQQKHAMVAGDSPPREVLESEVEGEFLVEDDPRTTEALKGYVLQAYHYLETGEGFCEESGCRLANPHRQPGVVAAQLQGTAFCPAHAERYRP
ncbi:MULTISPECIES: DUF7001 family protein [Halomicrobium]|uniref:Uncharacterized protein n=2 Tax=Halomicrobium mukohataei TaxID=57705 RepID=C7NVR0_HALMD|nr:MULTISPECIES: DUF6775 family putative metallopeptidase [Halomicrobium]ACV46175.1 conserved hypothetical protein [Halomicrobium mukohataei DSM 12286]QCD64744.1 hypothetical protein E5139_03445 [Halomicrobium mukohataei]QFR19551.1 hypothetical protein GBQ70_03445 [Halomicrobium sp. ZPS1]